LYSTLILGLSNIKKSAAYARLSVIVIKCDWDCIEAIIFGMMAIVEKINITNIKPLKIFDLQ